MQINLNDIKEKKIILEPDVDDYICPVTEDYVDKNYCESFSFGTGCGKLKTCGAYRSDKK